MKKVAIIATSTFLLLAAAGAGGLAYYLHNKKASDSNKPAPTNTVNLDKNDPSSQAGRSQPIPVKQDPTQSNPNGSGSGSSSQTNANPLTVTMTQATQQGSQLVIRALIAGTTSGTCTLTLTQAGQPTVTLSAGIDVQATYAICHGFNVPTSQLSNGGNWTATIVASSSDGRSGQAQQSIGVSK